MGMSVSLEWFLGALGENPALFLIGLLTLGVVLVNGWTDAPNAIATCISTRSMRPGSAIAMAAVFNFLGVFVMSCLNTAVAQTIFEIADFGGDTEKSLSALCAALTAIVLWSVAAWYFGIPTSESHALAAGITGAAVALQGGFSGINGAAWEKVLLGLLFSAGLGFVSGFLVVKAVERLFRGGDRRRCDGFFKGAQVAGGAAMAFMHGAQDGQKFIGVFLLGIFLAEGGSGTGQLEIPLWLMLLCSGVMGLGTGIGGRRIIKAVGMNMVRLERYQGFSADLAGAGCLLASSLLGMPVSTTHTKTAAVMGVGAAKGRNAVHWNVAGDMVLTWVLTFPGCGLIGYVMARLMAGWF